MENQLLQAMTLPNGLHLRNRFVKSAMSEALATRHHEPSHDLIALYDYWGSQSIGMLITGNVMVDRRYLGEPGNVVLDSESDLSHFQKWASVGQQHGVPLLLQLNHPGKQMYRSINEVPLAPSAVPIAGGSAATFRKPREMSVADISAAIEKFVFAGVSAKKAGFAGVQLHAAHGYLINQFLSPADNRRTDAYGGSLDNRMRFLIAIYQGIRAQVGPDFIIALKLNASDFTEEGFGFEECQKVVQKMTALGIDIIEISGGNYEKPVFGGAHESGAAFVNEAIALTQITAVPIVSTGGFRTKAQMDQAVQDGVSLIGLGRPFVLHPDLVAQYKKGTDMNWQTPRLSTGIRRLDRMLGPIIGIAYYEGQMKRLAKGKSVKITQQAWPYLLAMIRAHGVSALKPRRRAGNRSK